MNIDFDFGLQSTDVEKIRNTLANYQEIEKAIVYGSRAVGTYKKNSDIDLTLFGDKLNPKVLSNLEWQIDDLLLPYTFDLSIMTKISNPDLIAHINSVGKVIYQSTKTPSTNNKPKQ